LNLVIRGKKAMLKNLIAVTVAGSFLVGCQTVRDNPNTAGGAILGALGGAAVGALLPGNDRRGALIGAGVGLLAGAAVGQYLDNQERELRQSVEGTGAEVYRDGDALLVRFPANVTFDVGSSAIRPGFYRTLDDVSMTLNRFPESYLDVVGHTDSTGSEASNQALSERRANSVSNHFRSRGVLPGRIAAYGMGETQPIASNADAYGRAQNRRVELRITPATRG
jgi:outer membrane protein OmpA-like peptidoglycan-associated protein